MIVRIDFNYAELQTIAGYAGSYQINTQRFWKGKSREKTIAFDQFTGHLGEAALSKFFTGSIELHCRTRDERDKNPFEGDGGQDLLGYDIDIKTSRAKQPAGYNYSLIVEKSLFNPGWRYVFALVHPEESRHVYLMGWTQGDLMKPQKRYFTGNVNRGFKDTWEIKISGLFCMTVLTENWHGQPVADPYRRVA